MSLGILVVSFGTTYADSREKNIERILSDVKEMYPGVYVQDAISSGIVRKIMKSEEQIETYSTKEALLKMEADGITKIIVLPTHVIDGIENNKMKQEIAECEGMFEKIVVGRPLLERDSDYEAASKALWQSISDVAGASPVILMGHGTTHQADESYRKIEAVMRKNYHHALYVATVEGQITIEDVISDMKKEGILDGRVLITPFMLVAGDHANNDMAGDEDSFVSKLLEAGYQPECLIKGIGEYREIRKCYLNHLKDAMQMLEER